MSSASPDEYMPLDATDTVQTHRDVTGVTRIGAIRAVEGPRHLIDVVRGAVDSLLLAFAANSFLTLPPAVFDGKIVRSRLAPLKYPSYGFGNAWQPTGRRQSQRSIDCQQRLQCSGWCTNGSYVVARPSKS